MIAVFNFDNLEDKASGEDPALFNSFPFLRGTDTYWEATMEKSIRVEFNGEWVSIPRWGEGAVLSLL